MKRTVSRKLKSRAGGTRLRTSKIFLLFEMYIVETVTPSQYYDR